MAIVSAWLLGLEGSGTRYQYKKEDAGGGIGHQPPLRGDLVDQLCSEFCCTKGRTVQQLPPFLGLLVNYGTVIPNASEESYSRKLGKFGEIGDQLAGNSSLARLGRFPLTMIIRSRMLEPEKCITRLQRASIRKTHFFE